MPSVLEREGYLGVSTLRSLVFVRPMQGQTGYDEEKKLERQVLAIMPDLWHYTREVA